MILECFQRVFLAWSKPQMCKYQHLRDPSLGSLRCVDCRSELFEGWPGSFAPRSMQVRISRVFGNLARGTRGL
jgi:hypothetical protein